MMMPGFPAGTSFIPYLTLRNSAAQPLDVTLRLNYMAGMEDGTPVNRNLTTQRLGPFEAKQVDVQRMLNAGGLKSFDGIVNLGMSYTGQIGDLILATGSVDQTGTYVFEVEPREVASSRSKFANYWSVANGSDTMFSLWNPTDAPQDIIATLYYGDGSGRYRFPVHLAAQASTMIDVAMLIMEKTRDLDGNVIPTHIHEGSAAFDNAKAQDRITVVIAAGTYNVLTATCSGGCISCCGTSNFAIDPSNFYCPIGESMPCSAHGSDCYGNTVYPTVFSWTSNNTAVMTVNSSGVVQGVSGGQATINADLGFLDVYTGTICGSGLGSCPTQHVGTGTGATVQVPTSLQVVANDTHVISESYANCSENVYGIAIAIHYQVLDQNGVAITSNQMEPQETVTNWVANNVNLGDRIPNWQDIGPTSYPGTSQYTDGSGRFWDAPFGFCFNVPTTTTETQSISILLSGTRYPTVASAARTNYWYSDTSSPGHGSITNNNDVSQSR